jgi:diguanylate cyclase (GGDEF)-like protein
MRAELGPGTAGRLAAWLFVAAGSLGVITLPLPRPPGMNVPAVVILSAASVGVGAIAYFLPWDRWGRATNLVLVPVGLTLIGLGNAFGSDRPYAYSLFFIVAFAWIGMAHQRWTSIWFAAPATVAYVLPIISRPDASQGDVAAAAFVIPVCVLVAELIAWIVASERHNRESAHALARVASALGQHLDETRLSQTLVDESRLALGSEHAVLFHVDPVSMMVHDVHGSGVPEPVELLLERLPGTKLEALPSEIIGGDPMVVTDVEGSRLADVVLRFGVKSYVAVPVMARGALVGLLSCWETSHQRTYSDEDLSLARALAGLASAAIENARLYEKTLEASRADPLTGLGNRRAFRERLETEVERARRYGRELSLVLLDCDRFKAINDTLGHHAGDRVLERIGEMLQRNRRLEDGTFRIGGDEFAVLLPETSADGASVLAERLRRGLERAALGAERAPLTASFGVAAYAEHGVTADELYEMADGAMYEVKEAGGNATSSPPATSRGRILRLGVDIDSVIDNELLYSMYQPIFDLPSGKVMGFETYVRLDPVVGHTPTSTLFRAAAGAGALDDLDRVCRQTALRSANVLPPGVALFLNVAPAALAAEWAVAEDICMQIDTEGILRSQVVVEVTQHERSSSSRGLMRNLRGCQHEGVRIGMDDFAAAPSDLDLLAAINFDFVKVDMGSLHGTTEIDARRAVLRALCVLIRETGALPIAEGVESPDDLRLVHDLGFVAAQGFLLRAPASVPDTSARPMHELPGPQTAATG